MKKLILILFLIPLLCKAQLKADKYYHVGVGSGISLSVNISLKGENVNPFKGSIITLPVATFKEMYDTNQGGAFSFSDIGVTLIGALVIDGLFIVGKKIRGKKRKNKIISML